MLLRISPVLIILALCVGAQPAKAEPIPPELKQFAKEVAWDLAKGVCVDILKLGVNKLYDKVIPKDVKEDLRNYLGTEEKRYADNPAIAAELKALRESINDDKMERKQVLDAIAKGIAKINKDTGKIVEGMIATDREVEKLRLDIEATKSVVRKQQEKILAIEYDAGVTRGVLRENVARVDVLREDVDELKQKVEKVERYILNLGIGGFKHLWNKEYAKSLELFEDAILEDSGEPAFHYGKAIVLYKIGKEDEALQALKTGVNAERKRVPAPRMFDDMMEKTQGPERIWFSDSRKIYQAFTYKRTQQN